MRRETRLLPKHCALNNIMKDQLRDCRVLRRCWPEHADSTSTHIVNVNGVAVGGPVPVVIAGPCAVESHEQTLNIATACKAVGATLLRGGAYKPRTHPASFQGLGLEGLKILADVRDQTGLGIVTEVMDTRKVEEVAQYADMLQIGSRSMQNYPLLKEVGRAGVPVLLKRGWSATMEEWLYSAEYIAHEGNLDIVMCERGIRTGCNESYARNVLDLSIIDPLRALSPLPVIVDPSHATGDSTRVAPMSRAALACGAHGLLIEVVDSEASRANLRCDREQGITPDILADIVAHATGSFDQDREDPTRAPEVVPVRRRDSR